MPFGGFVIAWRIAAESGSTPDRTRQAAKTENRSRRDRHRIIVVASTGWVMMTALSGEEAEMDETAAILLVQLLFRKKTGDGGNDVFLHLRSQFRING